jgi:hypothetical protein
MSEGKVQGIGEMIDSILPASELLPNIPAIRAERTRDDSSRDNAKSH